MNTTNKTTKTETSGNASMPPPDFLNELEKVYNAEYTAVFRFVYNRLERKEDAADIVSNTFYKAMKNSGSFEFRRDASLKSWIFRIAMNEVLLYYRRKKTERKYYLEEKYLSNITDNGQYDESGINLLKQSLERLSESDYELIQMKYFDGLSFAEMASILGKSEESLRVKIHRIRKKLETTLLQLSRSKGVEILITLAILLMMIF